MYISNPDLATLLQSSTLNQESSTKSELPAFLNCFETFLQYELLHTEDSSGLFNSNSSSFDNSDNSFPNILSVHNNMLTNQLFTNLIAHTLLEHETGSLPLEDKNQVARIYSQNQPIYSTSSNSNYNKIFNNDVFLGDSITKGLSAYKLLDDSKVYAQVGIGTDKVRQLVDSAAKQNPQRVFIMCGVNDVGKYTKAQFTQHYTDLINTVKAECPNAKIYVQSILPVQNQATQRNPSLNNVNIDEYNSAIFQIANNENVGFINPSSLVNFNQSYYANDGIHYKPSFYTSWLNFLQNNAL
ncbi:GDSL-like lipase/acylhydrolase [Desulfosporosinus acididurans]|uniref:GDSL-like lipase/acylhydrolase n=1 Tax=Desulfosporosinus acididurans TaxID=476652 RepID=A0A0J1IRX3_9FIRM|nr:GDSL-type esterase/lipase family protein [Desulfosporosinus acididurans]KLU67421.1 GDSL-like lipase/acylhydrolase [Desulfosporosinus acididurans]